MPLIRWTNELSVGLGAIDSQHQQLLAMLNDLHDAMLTGTAKSKLPQIVSSLNEYATTHFASEERFMMQAGYPNLREHQVEHAAFTRKVKEFQEWLPKGTLALTLETMEFLRDWLVNHIQRTDKRYAPYLIQAGVR
jgi:hemerythrin